MKLIASGMEPHAVYRYVRKVAIHEEAVICTEMSVDLHVFEYMK
jgi:hypothetical protein